MHAKLVITLFASAVLSWFAASAAFAATAPAPRAFQSAQMTGAQKPSSGSALDVNPLVTNTITATVTPTATLSPGNDKIAKAIANRFGVNVNEAITIHDEIHGWGEVFLVFALADRSGETPEEILAMREDGGWGKIFIELGLHPGLKKDNLGGAITVRPKPTAAPTGVFSSDKHKTKGTETHELNDDDDQCSEHVNDNDNVKDHPCKPSSSPFPFPNGNSNHQPNNKGKGH